MPELFSGRVLLVPNNKFVETGMFKTEERYFLFLMDICNALNGMSRDVSVLFHTEKDHRIYQSRFEEKGVSNFYSTNPFLVKGAIGKAAFVVTSRYHAMINALTQGVPCAVMGWTEKYRGFLEFYDLAESLMITDLEKTKDRIGKIFSMEQSVYEKVVRGKQCIKKMQERMWRKIDGILE